VKGSTAAKEAQQYINLVLDPLPQLGQANEVPYGPTNKTLQPVLAAYPELAKKFPSSPDDIKKLYRINWTLFNKNFPRAISLWNRQILSR